MNWETDVDIRALSCIKQIVGTCGIVKGAQLGALWWLGGVRVGWGGVQWGGAGRQIQEGGDICIHTADSLRCIAATNTICKAAIPNFEKILLTRFLLSSRSLWIYPGLWALSDLGSTSQPHLEFSEYSSCTKLVLISNLTCSAKYSRKEQRRIPPHYMWIHLDIE